MSPRDAFLGVRQGTYVPMIYPATCIFTSMRVLRVTAVVIVALIAVYLVLAAIASPREPAAYTRLLPQGGPAVLAHAGGALLWPDNTLTAFAGAASLGADVLELDVHETADGEFVVIHDDTVDRTTDGTGAVAEMTLAELRELDAGYRFTTDGGRTHPYRGRGVRIPTIEEVLETTGDLPLTIELKTAAAQEPLFRALRRFGAEHRVVVAGLHDAFRSRIDEFPGPVSASLEQFRRFVLLHRLRLSGFYRPPFDVAQVPDSWQGKDYLDAGLIAALRAHGIPVHVWTVNDVQRMRKFLDDGAAGIVTDRPDRLAALLTRHYGRPPAPAAIRGGGPLD